VVDLAAKEISRTMRSRHAFDRVLLRVIELTEVRESGGICGTGVLLAARIELLD
jgi:hypothetical protein